MKKALSLILVLVICLSLCACGGKSNEIELTKENVSKYLDIYTATFMDHSKEVEYCSDIGWLANYWSVSLRTEGLSSNFNYNDIFIKVQITITYTQYADTSYVYSEFEEVDTKTASYTVEITPDIAGNGIVNLSPLDLGNFYTTDDNGKLQKKVEILEISGTVSPA